MDETMDLVQFVTHFIRAFEDDVRHRLTQRLNG
jgi:hypothetical protein